MPVYVYRCVACAEEIERRQGFYDAPLTTCESCGGELRRVLHAVGVIFKGSGFYTTDYRNGSSGKSAESGSNGSTSNGSSTKAEGGEKSSATSSAKGGSKSD